MDYGTAVHEAGHIIGYNQWGFTRFVVEENVGDAIAHVRKTCGTDRNFVKTDSEIVSLMGPEAELMVTENHEEYLRGAVSDWEFVFGSFPSSEYEVFTIQCDNKLYVAQYYLEQRWDDLINLADRIANGQREISIAVPR